MPRPIALITSGIFTLLLLGVIGLVAVWATRPPASAPATGLALEPAEDLQAVYEARVEQAQTAMTEHEAEYQTRLTELERIAQEREAEYKTRLNEGDVQIASYQAQIEEITQAMATHQDQVAQLEQALQERYILFETRRQEFDAQHQERLGQLQAQLNEGKTNLTEANAQLGR